MKRREILDKFEDLTVDQQDEIVSVIDHFESRFKEIEELLKEFSISNLDSAHYARKLAEECAEELY